MEILLKIFNEKETPLGKDSVPRVNLVVLHRLKIRGERGLDPREQVYIRYKDHRDVDGLYSPNSH